MLLPKVAESKNAESKAREPKNADLKMAEPHAPEPKAVQPPAEGLQTEAPQPLATAPDPNRRRGCRELLTVLGFFVLLPVAFGYGLTELEGELSNIERTRVELDPNLTATRAKSLDLLTDLIKTFMGWNIAIVGASFFFLKFVEKGEKIPAVHVVTAGIIAAVAVVAIFLGQMAIDAFQIALWEGHDPRKSRWVMGLLNFHWTLTVVGVAMFAVHAVYVLLRQRS